MHSTREESTDIGSEDVIEVTCKITETSDLEECHGRVMPRNETTLEVESVFILGEQVDLSVLSKELLDKIQHQAAYYLLEGYNR